MSLPIRPDSPFLTSSEAAALLNVGPSSIKRWTRSGQLRCEITAGGHRRFARGDVEAFARRQAAESSGSTAPDPLVDALLSDRPAWSIQASIFERRARAGSWHATADELAGVFVELGERWARREVTILEEHRASERVTRAVSACADTLVPSDGARRALLAVAEGDEHALALRLAELCLRDVGWDVEWAGPGSPIDEIVARIERGGIGLVGVSASECSVDTERLADQLQRLHAVCSRHDVHVVLGGRGAWPPVERFPGDGVHRVSSFREFHDLLAGDLR